MGRGGEITVRAVVANHLLLAEVFVLVVLYRLPVRGLTLKAAVHGQALHLVTEGDSASRHLLLLYVIDVEETFREIFKIVVLM